MECFLEFSSLTLLISQGCFLSCFTPYSQQSQHTQEMLVWYVLHLITDTCFLWCPWDQILAPACFNSQEKYSGLFMIPNDYNFRQTVFHLSICHCKSIWTRALCCFGKLRIMENKHLAVLLWESGSLHRMFPQFLFVFLLKGSALKSDHVWHVFQKTSL